LKSNLDHEPIAEYSLNLFELLLRLD